MSCSLVLPPKPELVCVGGKFSFKKTMQYFKRAGQLKKQIELQYYALPDSCDSKCKEELGEALVKIEKELDLLKSIFPRIFQRLKNLEDEMEHIGRQLLKELEMFLTKLIITILEKVIGLLGIFNMLNFPIPFLGSTTLIDENGKPYQYTPRILDFFTTEGKSKIKAAMREREEDVRKFLKKFDDQIDEFFTGEWNLISKDYSVEELWQRFLDWIERTLNNFIAEIITAVIKLIENIIPIPFKFLIDPVAAIEEAFNELWDGFKKRYQKLRDELLSGNLADKVARKIYEQLQAMLDDLINTILSIPIPLFGTLGDVLGITFDIIEEKIPSKEKILAKIQGAWKRTMEDIRRFFQRDWYQKIFRWLYNTISSVILDLLKAVPIIAAFIKAVTLIVDIVTGKISQCTAMEFFEKTTGVPITGMANRIYSLIPSCFSVEYKEGGYMPQPA